MNEPPMPSTPPFGEDTDEALSALLDGELGAFASEHDLSEAEARAQLEGWPGAEGRLAELEAARAALRTPVPALDDLTRRRLVHAATSATAADATQPSATRARRSWATIVSVAAAGLLVVAGLGVAVSSISSDGGGNDASSGANSATSADAAAPLRGDVGDLGDITSPAALRALLDRRASAERGSDAASTTTTPPPSAAAGDADSSKRSVVDPTTCAQTLAGTADVTFTGTGIYRGAPVTIFGVTTGGRTIVFVVSSTDCTKVLTSISR